MAKNLGPTASILVLENHGPLTGGANIADAMWLMYVVDFTLSTSIQSRNYVNICSLVKM